MNGPCNSSRRRRPGAVVLAVSLVFFAVAGVVHHHGLPGPVHGSTVFDGDRHHRESDSGPCLACRSSHEHVSIVVAPPTANPALPEPCRAVVPEAAPLSAPSCDAGGSRAPPSVPPFSV